MIKCREVYTSKLKFSVWQHSDVGSFAFSFNKNENFIVLDIVYDSMYECTFAVILTSRGIVRTMSYDDISSFDALLSI